MENHEKWMKEIHRLLKEQGHWQKAAGYGTSQRRTVKDWLMQVRST